MTSRFKSLLIFLQYLLPQHMLSRLAGRLTEVRIPWFKNLLIRLSISRFKIDLSDALETDPEKYTCFNDFFTRALRNDARKIDTRTTCIISPADGAISQASSINAGQMIQAKGKNFSVASLLNVPTYSDLPFLNGSFATIYLSPSDYHRVHMPFAGTLRECRYIPGSLFSVNEMSTKHIDQLFSRNERLICRFDTEFGDMALVLVGAMLVAGIESAWHGHYHPGLRHTIRDKAEAEGRYQFNKGEEIGRFKFGSTVIMLLPRGIRLEEGVMAGQAIQMGSALAHTP